VTKSCEGCSLRKIDYEERVNMIFFDLTLDQWLDISFAIVVFLVTAFFGRWAIKMFFGRILRRFTQFTKNTLDDAILDAIAPPLYWLALIYAFQFAHDRLGNIFRSLRFDLEQVYFVLFALVGFIVAWRLIGNIATWYGEQLAKTGEVELGEQLLPFFRRVILIILTMIVIIILLDYFEVEVQRIGNNPGDRLVGDRTGRAGRPVRYNQRLRHHGRPPIPDR